LSNRLLVFTENYAIGGGNRYMVDLVNAIAVDFEDTIFISNKGGIYQSDLARLTRQAKTKAVFLTTRSGIDQKLIGVPRALQRLLSLMLLAIEPFLLLMNVLLLLCLIVRFRPSMILACNGGYPAAQASLAMVLAARLCGVKVVLSIVSMPSRRRWYMWLYDRLLDALIWRLATRVVVNAAAIETELIRLRDFTQGRAIVVHNGIEDCAHSEQEKESNGRFVIGCVARLDVMKGALVLFDAFTKLANERSDVFLVLAGVGDASSGIEIKVKEQHLEHRVELLGHFTGDVDNLLRSFDIFAFPSLWEGFPYSLLEAMRAGCAIVASNVGGISEALEDARDGILVAPGSSEMLLAALRTLISNAALRHTLATNARARFVDEFSLEKMHLRMRTVLKDVS
jgi:glycosyltransferase involved in cell wall biosynthesis